MRDKPNQPDLTLRVLHISGRSDHGGGPEHILQVITAQGTGVEHHVACPISGIYWNRFKEHIGHDRLVAVPHRRISLLALLRLRTFARDRDITVIHSHGMSGGVYGRLLGLISGLPVVYTFHGVPVVPSLKHRLYHLAEVLLARATRVGIAVSAGEAALIQARWRTYRDRLVVIPNGIALTKSSETVPEWAEWPPRQTLKLVSFSRRNRQKYPELLVEIARCLHVMNVDFRIDAYGEGLDHPTLNAAVKHRNLDGQLLFHPPTDDPAIALAKAHIYLSTSRWEGMPLAVLEAWRAGLVVVASDVVGNRDLIAVGRTGLLFPADDGRSAARIIRGLLNDPHRVEEIRNGAKQQARTCHGQSLMSMRLEWLYRNITERGLTRENVVLSSVNLPEDVRGASDRLVISRART